MIFVHRLYDKTAAKSNTLGPALLAFFVTFASIMPYCNVCRITVRDGVTGYPSSSGGYLHRSIQKWILILSSVSLGVHSPACDGHARVPMYHSGTSITRQMCHTRVQAQQKFAIFKTTKRKNTCRKLVHRAGTEPEHWVSGYGPLWPGYSCTCCCSKLKRLQGVPHPKRSISYPGSRNSSVPGVAGYPGTRVLRSFPDLAPREHRLK
eukprot:2542827-Rhodomonas_salina.1